MVRHHAFRVLLTLSFRLLRLVQRLLVMLSLLCKRSLFSCKGGYR